MTRKRGVEIGDCFTTKEGYTVEVIDYKNSKDTTIKFIDSHRHTKRVTVDNLKKGEIKNPYHKSIFGIGYCGHGKYKPSKKGKHTQEYRLWCHILERAYYQPYIERFPTYKDVTVCEEWHNFQSFADWCYQQPKFDGIPLHVDKDLLVFGNKMYGPTTCSLVPSHINMLMTNINLSGKFPAGVSRFKNKYKAEISIYGKKRVIGYYCSPEEAHESYRETKEKYVKEVANRYKEYLNPQVYQNLMGWKLEDLEIACHEG